ncbi:MAG: ATP-binding cassette domain-containing protein, partial [Lachnospiraceae bacterium]|nr:ATP-binding cassette domain-containing protein [Lachnospiraceae bacterium]
GDAIIKVKDLVKINADGKRVLDGLSFNIRAGEVIGIAGVEGNGQSELSDVLSGMDGFASGTVELNGQSIEGKSVFEIRQMGMALIPEDRMIHGAAGEMSICDNIISDRYFKPGYKKGMFINKKYIENVADEYIKEFQIACDNKKQAVRYLSGGNIQKVVVAREFTTGGNFIIANQPTRGIDVGAAEMIRKAIVRKSREEGTATLLISADLNEVLGCSDKLFVMRKGKIVAVFPKASEVSEAELGEYMLGLKTMTEKDMEGLL